ALSAIARDFPDELRSRAATELDTDELAMLNTAIDEEAGRWESELLIAMRSLDPGPFTFADGSIACTSEALAALQEMHPGATTDSDFVRALGSGIGNAQRLIARQLEVYRPRIKRAAQFLRGVAAEVPDGAAVAMRADNLDPSSAVA